MSGNSAEVLHRAIKDNKNVFIDFYTPWCGGCRSYDLFVFSDTSFQEYIRNNFYSLKLNAEAPENIDLVKKYKVTGYPTLIIANSSGIEINRIVGFYNEKPQYYIRLIESMLKGKETFSAYRQEYLLHPDSAGLIYEITDKLFSRDEYSLVREFSGLIKESTKNEKIRFDADLYKALADARDERVRSPAGLLGILNRDGELSSFYKEAILSELIVFYKDQQDSFEWFNYQLLAMQPENTYYTRDFLEYLFLNKKDLATANQYLVDFNKKNSKDHWSAYLTALSFAVKNEVEKGAEFYDEWLVQNLKTIDNDWPYFFYVKYATLYKTRIEKAIEYAYKIENSCDKINVKIYLAQLLHEKGENMKSIEKLKEVIPLISKPEEKKRIDEMIREYKK